MSTKIHNGYILPQADYPELLQAAQAVRKPLSDIGEEIIERWISERATDIIDTMAIGQASRETRDVPLQKAIAEYVNAEKDAKTRRYPDIDVTASFTFHLHEGRFYALIYAENERIQDCLTEGLGAVEFFYWNNTDRPDGLSKEDWDLRERTWDRIIGRRAPIECGATFEFPASTPSFSVETAIARQPSFEIRVQAAARLILLKEKMSAESEENPTTPLSTTKITEVYYKVRTEMKQTPPTEDGARALEIARNTLTPHLGRDDFLKD